MDASTLSAEAKSGLAILADESQLDDKSFKHIVKVTFTSASAQGHDADEEGRQSTASAILESPALADVDPASIRTVYAGLMTLILEAARTNSSGETLT